MASIPVEISGHALSGQIAKGRFALGPSCRHGGVGELADARQGEDCAPRHRVDRGFADSRIAGLGPQAVDHQMKDGAPVFAESQDRVHRQALPALVGADHQALQIWPLLEDPGHDGVRIAKLLHLGGRACAPNAASLRLSCARGRGFRKHDWRRHRVLRCACGLRLGCGHRVVGCTGGLLLGCVPDWRRHRVLLCACGLRLGCGRRALCCACGLRLGYGCREHVWRRLPEPVGSTTFGAVRHGNKEAQKWRADTSGLTRNGYGPRGSLDRPSGTNFKLRL